MQDIPEVSVDEFAVRISGSTVNVILGYDGSLLSLTMLIFFRCVNPFRTLKLTENTAFGVLA